MFLPTLSHAPHASPPPRCDRVEADLQWQWSFSEVSAFFNTLSCAVLLQHHVGTDWYQLVPGEDRGRTGSVRAHRLSRGRERRRCASAPAPATLPLINRPGPDN